MKIEEIMKQVKDTMDNYNLTFEQALELFKVQNTLGNLESLCEKLDKTSAEISNLSEKVDAVVAILSYTNFK
ncbi:hypothetical protein [[Clostridium] dakarense]|uniref:hypothetical protein n=1 Tax=Faecalimicrobium dakarense TaxID=1301100 RepID=UPI0004B2758A|nr:hypothetical protein [[Clostridium] dakarense]